MRRTPYMSVPCMDRLNRNQEGDSSKSPLKVQTSGRPVPRSNTNEAAALMPSTTGWHSCFPTETWAFSLSMSSTNELIYARRRWDRNRLSRNSSSFRESTTDRKPACQHGGFPVLSVLLLSRSACEVPGEDVVPGKPPPQKLRYTRTGCQPRKGFWNFAY